MHTFKADIKHVYKMLDTLQSAYVIDNTKMIEIDEICIKNRKALAVANSVLGELESQAAKVRNFKEQLSVKIF